MQSVKPRPHEEESACSLPPQEPLRTWLSRGRALASQSATLLQQLAWLHQCCPEDLQQQEAAGSGDTSGIQRTLMCPSPVAAQCQPPACLMRKGDGAWRQLHLQVKALLGQSERLKAELDGIEQQISDRRLVTWYKSLKNIRNKTSYFAPVLSADLAVFSSCTSRL